MIKQASEDCFTFLGKLLDINVGHEWLPVALNGGFFWCKRDCLLCGGCAVICWVSSPRWHLRMHQLHCNQNPSSYLSQNVFSERLQVSQGVCIVDLASERLLLKWVNLGTSRHIETLALKIKMTIDPTVLHSWNCWKTYTDVLLDKFYIFLVLTIFGSLLTCLIRLW